MLRDIFKIKEFKNQILKLENELKDYRTLVYELESNERNLKSYVQKLETQLNDKNSCDCEQSVDEQNEQLETIIDVNKFITHQYASGFNAAMDFCNSDKERLRVFNNYLNDEKIYVSAIVECLKFIMYKKNNKEAIAKQLKKYLLTKHGKEIIEGFINNVNEQ